ncbi:MAG: hypothetical protein K9K32_06040 [Halanaerobiales bacterium]|nr:hypothetical protein [Halanaerobiales bacterium]
MSNKDYTTNALMAVTASRLLEDNQNVVVGLGLPQIATLLAQYMHAPNINIIYEIGVINPEAVEMGVGIADPRLWYKSEHFTSFAGTLGGLLQRGKVDVGFLGGLQVDKYGNLNSTLIEKEDGIRHFTGSGGAADIATYSKNILAIMKHQKRKIVDTVDYLTSVGYLRGDNSRQDEGIPGCENITIITNKCVFTFERGSKQIKLESIHPGIELKELKESTGCDFVVPEQIKLTDEPTDKEIKLLDTKVDPNHLYI